jgi:ubiquinone/menaquinone biosynthesis C-methylase UbiE
VGIDTERASLAAARATAERAGLNNAEFVQADALHVPMDDGTYDLVSCGNVPTFTAARTQMIGEAVRLVRPHGVVAAVPMYYVKEPPEAVRRSVEAAIRAPIDVIAEEYWLTLYESAGLVLRGQVARRFVDIREAELRRAAQELLASPVNDHHRPERRAELAEALARHYVLFNENNRYLGYSVLAFRTPVVNRGSILFRTRPA